MDSRKTWAIDKALSYINNNIDNGTWKQGTRLPTLVELAQLANVGVITMHKALAVLKSRKLLTLKQKTGIFVGPFTPVSPKKITREAVIKNEVWKDLAGSIRADILDGEFVDSDIMPSSKELMQRYKTGFRTVKKALDVLVKDHLLSAQQRRFVINDFKVKSSTATICFIATESVLKGAVYEFEQTRLDEFMRSLEKDCSLKNIHLIQSEFFKYLSDPLTNTNTLGHIIWSMTETVDNIIKLVQVLLPFKKPVVIINPGFTFVGDRFGDLVKLAERNSIFFLDVQAERYSGFEVGRFLYSKGHRHITFCSYGANYSWEQERYEGIIDAYHTLGFNNAVERLSLKDGISENTNIFASKEMETTFIKEHQDFNRIIEQLKKTTCYPDNIAPHLELEISEYQNQIHYFRKYYSLFKQALAYKKITAWVCADDYLANFAALKFLKHEQIKVPEKIGLIGFNDQTGSSLNSLSSYRYNFSKIALKAINIIISPGDIPKKRGGKPGYIIPVDGMVIDRGSV